MRTSILICATCLLVTGCSAQFRLPSLSSALSSLTGFGGSSSNSNGAQSGQSSSPSSPYSGLVRDYGRNLMMAMSSIYPTLFKPPQSQQQQQQPQAPQQAQPSPFESFGASQPQSLFSSQGGSGPSFTLGGSTFSISPSFPFGALSGGAGSSSGPQQAAPSGPGPQPAGSSHSPFSASFGSSINSPPSFGALSSSPFLSQSMPSFAPASSYGAAFEAANGGGPSAGSASMFAGLGQSSQAGPGSLQSLGSMPSAGQLSGPSFGSLPAGFGAQHDPSSQLLSQPSHHQPQSASPQQVLGAIQQQQQQQQGPQSAQQQQQSQHAAGPFGQGPAGQQQAMGQQFGGSQQFRPDMMSMAASAPVPSSSSYSNYGSVPAQQGQAPSASISGASYQQPSYR